MAPMQCCMLGKRQLEAHKPKKELEILGFYVYLEKRHEMRVGCNFDVSLY
jgi:hypothetical protein